MQNWLLLFSILAFVAGAAQTLAPDHWFPLAVMAWQRGWGKRTSLFHTWLLLAVHVFLGAALFFLMEPLWDQWSSKTALRVAIGVVVIGVLVRAYRLVRVREVARAGVSGRWAFYASVSLLGPSEALLPVMVKARELGTGYLLPMAAFGLGTTIVGVYLVFQSRSLMSKPLGLPRVLGWAETSMSVLPTAMALTFGIIFLSRMH